MAQCLNRIGLKYCGENLLEAAAKHKRAADLQLEVVAENPTDKDFRRLRTYYSNLAFYRDSKDKKIELQIKTIGCFARITLKKNKDYEKLIALFNRIKLKKITSEDDLKNITRIAYHAINDLPADVLTIDGYNALYIAAIYYIPFINANEKKIAYQQLLDKLENCPNKTLKIRYHIASCLNRIAINTTDKQEAHYFQQKAITEMLGIIIEDEPYTDKMVRKLRLFYKSAASTTNSLAAKHELYLNAKNCLAKIKNKTPNDYIIAASCCHLIRKEPRSFNEAIEILNQSEPDTNVIIAIAQNYACLSKCATARHDKLNYIHLAIVTLERINPIERSLAAWKFLRIYHLKKTTLHTTLAEKISACQSAVQIQTQVLSLEKSFAQVRCLLDCRELLIMLLEDEDAKKTQKSLILFVYSQLDESEKNINDYLNIARHEKDLGNHQAALDANYHASAMSTPAADVPPTHYLDIGAIYQILANQNLGLLHNIYKMGQSWPAMSKHQLICLYNDAMDHHTFGDTKPLTALIQLMQFIIIELPKPSFPHCQFKIEMTMFMPQFVTMLSDAIEVNSPPSELTNQDRSSLCTVTLTFEIAIVKDVLTNTALQLKKLEEENKQLRNELAHLVASKDVLFNHHSPVSTVTAHTTIPSMALAL